MVILMEGDHKVFELTWHLFLCRSLLLMQLTWYDAWPIQDPFPSTIKCFDCHHPSSYFSPILAYSRKRSWWHCKARKCVIHDEVLFHFLPLVIESWWSFWEPRKDDGQIELVQPVELCYSFIWVPCKQKCSEKLFVAFQML